MRGQHDTFDAHVRLWIKMEATPKGFQVFYLSLLNTRKGGVHVTPFIEREGHAFEEWTETTGNIYVGLGFGFSIRALLPK